MQQEKVLMWKAANDNTRSAAAVSPGELCPYMYKLILANLDIAFLISSFFSQSKASTEV